MLKFFYSPYGMFLWTLILLLIFRFNINRKSWYSVAIVIFITVIYLSIANRFSYDSVHMYIPSFSRSDILNWYNYGFSIPVFIMYKFGVLPQVIPIILISIFTCLFFYFIYKIYQEKIDFPLESLLFVIFIFSCMISFGYLSMGLLRQYMGVALLIGSMWRFSKEDRIFGFFMIFLATMVHISNFIFLIFPLWIKVPHKYKILLLIASIILGFFARDLVVLVISIIPDESYFYQRLVNAVSYSNDNNLHNKYIFKYLASLLVFSMLYIFSNKYIKNKFDILQSLYMMIFMIVSISFFSKEASIRYLYVGNIVLAIWGSAILFYFRSNVFFKKYYFQ